MNDRAAILHVPGATIEAMYEATQHARVKGQWVEVVSPQH